VDVPPPGFGRDAAPQIHVCHLCERVHPRVGAPRPLEVERRLAGRLEERPAQLALHGPRVLLDLPPAVTRARVLDSQLVSRHEEGTGYYRGRGRVGRNGKRQTENAQSVPHSPLHFSFYILHFPFSVFVQIPPPSSYRGGPGWAWLRRL